MSTVLAVQLQKEHATFITARAIEGEPFTVLSLRKIPRAERINEKEPSASPSAAETEPGVSTQVESALTATDFEVDDTLGLIESDQILYTSLELPFRDQKKIEQVAPLQMQDSLPFDLEEFLVDSIVSTQGEGENYRIISSLVPKEQIAQSLAFCDSVGAEPRVITTGAAALSALGKLCHPDETRLVAYVEFAKSRVSLALLQGGKPLHFRDFRVPEGGLSPQSFVFQQVCRNIACSIARVEEDTKDKVETVYAVGLPEQRDTLARLVAPQVLTLRLEELIVNEAPEDIELADICWSLGLFASEIVPSKRAERELIDFRRGPFAFYRLWQDIWSAFQQELFYITLALVLGLFWWGGKIYTSVSSISAVENKIAEAIGKVLPGESVPRRAEVSYLQGKLDNLETELSGLGSLSSLSPLEALKEMTLAIGSGIDLSIDSLSIGVKRILLRGSVAENPQVGELSRLLKAHPDHFCDVQVDGKGKTANSRVSVTAELTLCE